MQSKVVAIFGVAAMLVVGSAANADFVNGNFEDGLNGWTIANTPNGMTVIQDTILFDIDAGGPLGDRMAGRVLVGHQVFQSGSWQGIELTQNTSINNGDVISVDIAAWNNNPPPGSNAAGGNFELLVNGSVLASFNVGSIDNGTIITGALSVAYAGASGTYDIGLRITRPYTTGTLVYQLVDNFNITPTPGALALLGLGGMFGTRRRRR